ncbi:DEKNAAC101179 [Brettanomyces naardenensis]|uniref:DEKNAAC101179 n=1 Tax=Brettanomyces naardenensis TaxID=13370 RepID=A0A448YH78_BRENA|nr:DEKNAAC101179 [Brettanomyces naardenensis]
MSEHKYHYDVTMACSGCSSAVNRVLTKLNGVKDIDISLEKQSVDVTAGSGLSYDQVLQTIAKTGKKINGGKVIA